MLVHLVVIDVELFHNNVIKELGISYGSFSRGFVFRPPYDLGVCPKATQRQNKWLSKNLHYMPWGIGEYDYDMLQTVITAIKPHRALYFCKGAEKAKILSSLFGHSIFNLDEMGCPIANNIDCFRDQCDSVCTTTRHKESLHCAQKKAIRFSDWLKDHL
jgi:hypothetical protein